MMLIKRKTDGDINGEGENMGQFQYLITHSLLSHTQAHYQMHD